MWSRGRSAELGPRGDGVTQSSPPPRASPGSRNGRDRAGRVSPRGAPGVGSDREGGPPPRHRPGALTGVVIAELFGATSGLGRSETGGVMQSNGGVMAPEIARGAPAAMLESKPVGGFIAAARMATRLDRPNVIAFNTGVTKAKANLRSAPWSLDLPHSRFRAGTGATISTYGCFENTPDRFDSRRASCCCAVRADRGQLSTR
jgi:hypothetical protein